MSLQEAFKGKRVLVTGAGRGMGRAVVKRLHSYGSIVYAVSKNPENLSTLKNECPSVTTIPVDLSDWNETRKRLLEIEPVDCLVNNAGIYIGGTFMDITPEDFDKVMDINVKALINVSQIVGRKMIETGKAGTIVNVSSLSGRKAFNTNGSYTISKAAVEHITKCMAIELGPYKIRVNSICPTFVDTDMRQVVISQKGHENVDEISIKSTPLGVLCVPMDDIVNTILFLLSDLASTITGESVAVDGGAASC